MMAGDAFQWSNPAHNNGAVMNGHPVLWWSGFSGPVGELLCMLTAFISYIFLRSSV
jgi:hypothetical protein